MWRSDGGLAARARLSRPGVLALAVALAGCATPRAPSPGAGIAGEWSGRFSVTWAAPADPPRDESAAGRFLLRESGGRTELDVFSPFGQTIARARAGAGDAQLETSDGRRFAAPSAEALTEEVLGWRAPVSRLPHWLRGEFATSADARPQAFVDGGWSVSIDEWGARAPQRMTLRWPAEPGSTPARRVTIRLILDPDA